MKFTDGQWLLQPGVRAHYATEARSITAEDGRLVVVAPVRPINDRGDTLQGPILTITLSSPLPDIVRVRIEHFTGGPLRGPQVPLVPQADRAATINDSAECVTLTAGDLTARVGKKRWAITFEAGGRVLTTSGWRGMSYMQSADRGNHVVEQLSLGVGENVYGVDAIKTDFGERIPTEGVVYYDGSDPVKMHNFYPIIYNETVFRAIEAGRGSGEAVLFARSSYTSGQRFPVHWGGDCWSTFESMAESLRGGLSLGLSGFGFWSHDIGGFEGTAPAFIYKRWAAFGLLSSHSRLHGSGSYRIPWAYDDEACDVLRLFTKLKCRLMPYLWSAALQAHREGVPMMRAMVLEFPGDPGCEALDRQYMLGDSLLVAPVFTEDGTVDYYLPAGRWTNLLTGQVQEGPGWHRERHGFLSLPLMVRPNTVLPLGAADNRPDYDYAAGVTFRVYEPADGAELTCDVSTPQRSESVRFSVHRAGKQITARVAGDPSARWQLQLAGMHVTSAENGAHECRIPWELWLGPRKGAIQVELTIFTRDCCLDTRVQSPNLLTSRRCAHEGRRLLHPCEETPGRDGGSEVRRHAWVVAALLLSDRNLGRRDVRGRAGVRWVVHSRMEGHSRVGHDGRAGPRNDLPRSVLRQADSQHHRQCRRSGDPPGLLARRSSCRAQGRGASARVGHRRYLLRRARARVLHLRRGALRAEPA